MNQRNRVRDDDRGVALVTVIGMGAVLALLMAAAIAYSVGSARGARTTQDWNAALAAAYAGVEEYQSRLADDTTYFRYGNPAHPFSAGSSVSMPPAGAQNAAFGTGVGGTWGSVAGSGGAAKFRYEVNNADYYVDGSIRIRSTGLAGGETRTIVADLKQQGFVDFLYFTDYEIQDPALYIAQWMPWAQANGISAAQVEQMWKTSCGTYAWAGRNTTGYCSEIAFGSNDVVNGPAHSNDQIRVCDARFRSRVTTAYNPVAGRRYLAQDSSGHACGGQLFDIPGNPAYSPVIAMPATNTQLRKETRSDLASQGVPVPGCLYTGPTEITFLGNGKMTVRSPWTRKTNVVGDNPTTGSAPTACGKVGTGSGKLGGPDGDTVDVPDDNVVYVQNVPTRTDDPNYSASAPAGLTPSTATYPSNGLGYPLEGEKAPLGQTTTMPAYGPRSGDAFIKGTLRGQLTVAAENYIYAVGDTVYGDSRQDVLGLIGNNAVFVWNPVSASNASMLGGLNRRIDAALMSVAHTFQVQNYSTGGNRGTLTVNGAIAQKYRGIVRSGNNGYAKNYVYDERFNYVGPPKFLSPVTTTYGVNTWVEVSPVWDPTGATR